MTSKEIKETIEKLECLFDKIIQIKVLENESRRLKIQESQGGKKFPSGGLIESKGHVTHEEWVEMRRNKIHEALTETLDSGRESYVLSSSDLKAILEAEKRNKLIFQEIIEERSCVSMFEFMGQVFNPENELTVDQIEEEFKKKWKCQE